MEEPAIVVKNVTKTIWSDIKADRYSKDLVLQNLKDRTISVS